MKKDEMLELFYASDRNLLLRAMVDEIYKRTLRRKKKKKIDKKAKKKWAK